jgi:predicted nucleic acid-binding protein
MKIVLDTNVLLVSIPKRSPYRLIFDSLLNKRFDLIISNDVLNEYTEIIAQKSNATVATNISEMLA